MLREAIEKARRTTVDHAPPNESCTCEWVILPLLHAAGYEHHEVLSRAWDANKGFPDYTILPNTPYTWYLEAKAWDHELNDADVLQGLNYAHANGKRWVVLTNGREWRLYDDHIVGVPAADRKVAQAKLEESDELHALLTALSKQSVVEGGVQAYVTRSRLAAVLNEQLCQADSTVVAALVATLRRERGLADVTGEEVVGFFQRAFRASMPPSPSVVGAGSKAAGGGAYTLVQLDSADPVSPKGRAPVRVWLPDGEEKALTTWAGLSAVAAKWLADAGKLPEMPFRVSYLATRCVLNTIPRHPDGTDMRNPVSLGSTQSTGPFIETQTSAQGCVRALVTLCKAVGVDPSQIRVEVSAVCDWYTRMIQGQTA